MTTTFWKLGTLVSSSVALALAAKLMFAPGASRGAMRSADENASTNEKRTFQVEAHVGSTDRDVGHLVDDLTRATGAIAPCQIMAALARAGGKDAVEAVGEALQRRRHERVRLCAIDALERMPSLRSTAFLSEAARDPSSTIRSGAIAALVKTPDPSGRITLLEISRGEDADRSLEALLALAEAQVSDAVSGLIAVLPRLSSNQLTQALGALGNSADAAAGPALVDYTTHPSSMVRQAAFEALGSLGGENAATLLRGVLERGRVEDLSSVARALASCGDEPARKALFDAVDSTRLAVSQAALRALVELDGDDVAQLMTRLITREPQLASAAFEYFRSHPIPADQMGAVIGVASRGGETAREAMEALSQQGGEAGRAAIFDLAKKPGPARLMALSMVEELPGSRDDKRQLYVSVLREGGQAASTAMSHLSEDPSDEARVALQNAVQLGGATGTAAINALGARSDPETERFLIDTVRGSDRIELRHTAISALANMGSEGARKTLLDLATNGDASLRAEALSGLATAGGPEAERAIAQAIEKGEPAMRTQATELLGTMRGPKVVGDLERLSRDDERGVKGAALSALIEAAPDRATSRVRELLTSKEPADRAMALSSMASIPGMFDRDALSTALKDEDADVSQAALGTIESNGGADAQELLASVLHRGDASDALKQAAAMSLDRLGGSVAVRERALIEKHKLSSEPSGTGDLAMVPDSADPENNVVVPADGEDEGD